MLIFNYGLILIVNTDFEIAFVHIISDYNQCSIDFVNLNWMYQKFLLIIFILITLLFNQCNKGIENTSFCDCASSNTSYEIEAIVIYIPNVITPNFDGTNDYWIIKNLNRFQNSTVNLTVSEKIYELSNIGDPTDFACDGKINNQPIKDGSYFYEININDKTYKGFLCLYGNELNSSENVDCLRECSPLSPDPLITP